MRKVKADGYGTNTGEWTVERKIGAIAMPIIDGKRVLGALNIVYLNSALTSPQAIERFSRPLKTAADKIAPRLRDSQEPELLGRFRSARAHRFVRVSSRIVLSDR